MPTNNPLLLEKYRISNTLCSPSTYQQLLVALVRYATSEATATLSVDFTNVHIVTARKLERDFYRNTSNVDYFIPDSTILSRALSLLYRNSFATVYGPHFLGYAANFCSAEVTHYFLGGSADCLTQLLAKLSNKPAKLKIVGQQNGYFSAKDNANIVQNINQSAADFLWVGLGTPKQQQWISQHKKQLQVKVCLAVGFAFDVNAGTKLDAPLIWHRLGLVWLYRLYKEPRRLWWRYAKYNSFFLLLFFWQLLQSLLLKPIAETSKKNSK